jgi:hypothetical protein
MLHFPLMTKDRLIALMEDKERIKRQQEEDAKEH